MRGKIFNVIPNLKCRKTVFFLAVYWICSIVAGAYLAHLIQDISISLMHASMVNRVSIVGLATVLLPPFILSAVAVYFSLPKLIYFCVVVKGICLGFNTYTLLVCYTDAAWLMYCLIFFSNVFLMIPLFLYWIRCLEGSCVNVWRNTFRCLIYVSCIGAIDYFAISPLISNVISSM